MNKIFEIYLRNNQTFNIRAAIYKINSDTIIGYNGNKEIVLSAQMIIYIVYCTGIIND
jgi:hypothetical protein